MANPKHLAILKQGVEVWNAWRRVSIEGPVLSGAELFMANLSDANLSSADLSRANLSETNLSGANLSGSDLSGADLSWADLSWADLSEANLTGADLSRTNLIGARLSLARLSGTDLSRADLSGAGLSRADLSGANLLGANLSEANLTGADLSAADLQSATLVNTSLRGAQLHGCRIFGISVWRADLEGVEQRNLIITKEGEPTITVDSLEVAQFIYLLLHNAKIRDVIDTIGKKAVLILGRFTEERLPVLNQLREELRQRGYLPILFDFDGPASRNLTETVSTLAHLSRFVIADLTDPRAIPQELQRIVPHLPSVPVQPILGAGQEPWGMFADFRDYPWVLEPFRYTSLEHLCAALPEHIIAPAVQRAEEIASRRASRG